MGLKMLGRSKLKWLFKVAIFVSLFLGSNGIEPGDMAIDYANSFKALHELFQGNDPRIQGQVSFFMELAKSAYHTGELRVGVEAIQIAIQLDPQKELEYVGMLCDLFYYMSRKNATVLKDVTQCLKRQYKLDKKGPNELATSTHFWDSYAMIQKDIGKYKLALAAMVRSRDASAAVGEGGAIGLAKPNTIRLLAKAATTAGDYAGALEVIEDVLDDWTRAALNFKMDTDVVADTWHDASLVLWRLGDIDQALYYVQTALAVFPEIKTAHAENYHQTLARLYLEIGQLELTRASLWGIAAINFETPPSSLARFGFEAMAKKAEEDEEVLLGEVSCADKVRLAALSMIAPSDPAMYFLLAQLSPRAIAQWPQCLTSSAYLCNDDNEEVEEEINDENENGDELEGFNLNKKLIQVVTKPNQQPFKAAVVYLCCADEKEAQDLKISLALWTKHFHANFPHYPVLILHDFLSSAQEKHIYESTLSIPVHATDPLDLRFAWLEPDQWHGPIPSGFDPSSMPVYGYGMGYRHMCRFFSGPLLHVVNSELKDGVDWVLRMDTDSFILTPVLKDPFLHMYQGDVDMCLLLYRNTQYSYGWMSAFSDQEYFTTGLGQYMQNWLEKARTVQELMFLGRTPTQAKFSLAHWLESVAGGHDGWNTVRMCLATNFFIVKTAWWESQAYQYFFDELDASGGFYHYRWGDACVHLFAAAYLLDKDTDVAKFDDITTYWHQGTVTVPLDFA